MKRFTITASLLAIGFLSAPSWSAPPDDAKGPRAGARGPRAAGQGRPAGAGSRDPQQMATMMLQRFDKDGDQKLNAAELTELLTALRNREGMGRRGAAGQGQAGQGQGQRRRGAAGGKRGQAGGNPGGERPKRPAGEE